MGWCRGSLGGKKLRCCGVRPHLNPLPRGEEVASLPRFWIPVSYRRTGRAIAGKTKWGRCVDVGGGIAVDVLSRNVSAWIPAPYRGTGQALRGNDEFRGNGVVAWYSESARRILPRPDPSGGRAPRLAKSSTALHSPHPHPLWVPAPYRGTGQALRWNDEMSGESLSRIGVREVLPCRYEAGPGLESIRS